MEIMSILEAALKYQEKGYSVIPVDQKKVPLVKWESHQQTRATAETIRQWWKKFPEANVGIVTGEISNLLVVDSDTVEATQRIQEAIPDSLVVPCQQTPSGGMHFVFSHQQGFVNRARVANGIDIRTSGGYFVAAPSINGNGKDWHWVVSPLEVDPPSIDLALTSLINTFSLYRESLTCQLDAKTDRSLMVSNGQLESVFFSEGRRDEDLFTAANCLTKGGSNYNFSCNILNRVVNSWGEQDSKWVEIKIKSAMDRAARKERNITQEFKDWISEVSGGTFLISNWYKESVLVSKQDKHTAIVAAQKFCEEGLIERTGTRRGEYRIIDKDIEYMDFKHVSKEGAIKLTLPLEIHKKTIFFPRNVIVIAGVTGYGKTSYLLNVIRDNMHKFKFKYFASEMSALALNYKLSRFDFPIDNWKMDVIPDYGWDYTNIQDKIFPNDMNVIDYLEPEGEKTYNIHEIITKIIKRLDKGMALIATQKKKGSDLSAGGVYSAKASSLYLSLDWGTIFIFKNRFREEDPNPGLNRIDFTIEPGQNFVPNGDWYDIKENKKVKDYGSFVKD